MKQLHKQTSLSHRRDEEMITSSSSTTTPPYSPKAPKHNNTINHRPLPRSINYLLREQRLLFILLGILIGSTFFIIQPTLSRLSTPDPQPFLYTGSNRYASGLAKRGRVPVGITSRRLRVVVTGGAGFVGSHLVDKLIGRGNDVIVVDNFFTGRKENLVHLIGNERFELIRHDVVESILLEVDQIYHLACERSCYDEGKRTAETLTMDYHRGAGVEVRIARIFNTYGPRMCLDDGRVVSNFVAQAIRKQPMTVYGDGKQTRSFQYVSDLV
ncbi:unnamed protein product [Lupinus luteus]|uniref:UDP-glucuronate decarboxylase n=1 Tax=Lupinus luteus TaxID=3873 RepID=A0AAV1WM60_LUPLU